MGGMFCVDGREDKESKLFNQRMEVEQKLGNQQFAMTMATDQEYLMDQILKNWNVKRNHMMAKGKAKKEENMHDSMDKINDNGNGIGAIDDK